MVDDAKAADILREIIVTNQYLLDLNLLHGDVKSENMLIHVHTERLKLIDLGSAFFMEHEYFHIFEGTEKYRPPEWIIHQRYKVVTSKTNGGDWGWVGRY